MLECSATISLLQQVKPVGKISQVPLHKMLHLHLIKCLIYVIIFRFYLVKIKDTEKKFAMFSLGVKRTIFSLNFKVCVLVPNDHIFQLFVSNIKLHLIVFKFSDL